MRLYNKYESFFGRFDWKPNFNRLVGQSVGKRKKFDINKDEVKEFLLKCNQFRQIKTNLVPKVLRKISYIYDYKVRILDNNPKLLYRRIKLDSNLSNFPIPLNGCSKIVGFTPDYVGMTEGRVAIRRTNNLKVLSKVIKFDKFSELYKLYVKELVGFREVLSMGYNTCVDNLKTFCTPPEIDREVSSMITILNYSKFKWFNMPMMYKPEREDIKNHVKFNWKSSPGHYCKRLIGAIRRDSIFYTTQVCEDLYTFLETKPLKNWNLWEILGREKDVKVVEGTDVASRLIMNTEEPMVLLLSLFAQPMSKMIQNDPSSRIFIGKNLTNANAIRVEKLRSEYMWSLETDWTTFDANISKNDMIIACAILMANFDLYSSFMRRAMYLITSSLVTKYVAINPGIVLRIDKGLPSGHPFTSLVTSVINLVYWSLIGFKIYGKNYACYMDLIVQGDDANVFFHDHPNLDKIDDFIAELGIKSDKVGHKFILNSQFDDIHDTPIFLKRKIKNGELVWNRSSVLRKIIYQTSKGCSVEDDIVLLKNYMITAPDDLLMNDLLTEMIRIHISENKEIDDDFDDFLLDVNAKSISNKTGREYMIGYRIERAVDDKVVVSTFKKQNKFRMVERSKYIFSLFTSVPPDLLDFYNLEIQLAVSKRDLKYLVFRLTGGEDPVKGIETDDGILFSF